MVTSQDGTAPVATTTGTLNIAITPVNDRPVALTPGVDVSVITAQSEGSLTPAGDSVIALFGPRFSDPKDAGQTNAEDTMVGVFITASAANPATEGKWQYAPAGTAPGGVWADVASSTNDAAAVFVPNGALIRFVPVDANYSGTPGKLSVRLVESDQTRTAADVPGSPSAGTALDTGTAALALGTVRNLTAPLAGTDQFRTGQVSEALQLTITVTPVADAPRLTIGTGPQEPGNPPGTTGAGTSPASPATGNDASQTVTGSVRGLEDTAIALGISVAPADTTNPESVTTATISGIPAGWVIKDGAGNVIAQPTPGTVTLSTAQLAGATITAPSDVNSSGLVGTSPAATLTVVVTSQDGTAPAATTTGTLNIAITPVNDAPAFASTGTTTLPSIPNDAAPVGVSVAVAFPGFSDVKDAGQSNGADTRVGVLIVANGVAPAQGNWQYLDGANWVNVPANLSNNNALYLPDGAQIRFSPAPGFVGAPGTLTARLVEDDQPGAKADLPANATGSGFGQINAPRSGVDLVAGVGGASRVSANTKDVGITITPSTASLPVGLRPQPEAIDNGVISGTPSALVAPSGAVSGINAVQNALVSVPPTVPGVLSAAASPLAQFSGPDGPSTQLFTGGEYGLNGSSFAPVGLAVRDSQGATTQADVASNRLFASNIGNSGLQPNWLAPAGIPGVDPFAAPQPEQPESAIVQSPVPQAERRSAEQLAREIECAKPRVVAKPRPPGYVPRPAPTFAPGSEGAKRFSDMLKRAKLRSKC